MEERDMDERVRLRAYELWEYAGRPCGREHEFWAAAAEEIEGARDVEETPPRHVAR